MARRVMVALLAPVAWSPPGIDPVRWRRALAEDVVDLLATLNEVEPAVAVTPADRWLADAVIWPGTPVYEVPVPTVNAVLATVTGYDQAAVIAADAPDVPGLTLGKLLRPLSTRQVAVAPADGAEPADSVEPAGGAASGDDTDPYGGVGDGRRPGRGGGLLGVASRLPAPAWLPTIDLDADVPQALRRAAPHPADVAVTPGWRRVRGPADLTTFDPAVEGWENTRALLSGAR